MNPKPEVIVFRWRITGKTMCRPLREYEGSITASLYGAAEAPEGEWREATDAEKERIWRILRPEQA